MVLGSRAEGEGRRRGRAWRGGEGRRGRKPWFQVPCKLVRVYVVIK